jgi:hypothetical protein
MKTNIKNTNGYEKTLKKLMDKLPVSDPVLAQEAVLEVLRLFTETHREKDKAKIKGLLLNASNKAMSQGHSYVATVYKETFQIMEQQK